MYPACTSDGRFERLWRLYTPDAPMPQGGKGTAPTFVVWAVKDPTSGNLDRIQIIKGWTKNGQSFEKIFDVVWSGDRKADKWTGRVPAIKSTVDLARRCRPRDPDHSSGAQVVEATRELLSYKSRLSHTSCLHSERHGRFNRQQESSTFKRENTMIQTATPGMKRMSLAMIVAISAGVLSIVTATARNPQMVDKLMAIKTAQDTNKQKLAQYSWTETETISIKGEVKDTKTYQVQMVNGQQQKPEVSNQAASQVDVKAA